ANTVGIETQIDALTRQNVLDCGGDLGVLALHNTWSHFDDRHLRPESPKHLPKLEADIAAADDDEVLRGRVEIHHRAICEERSRVESRQWRRRRPPADVDEDPVGAQNTIVDDDLAIAAKTRVPEIDVATRQPAEPFLDALAGILGYLRFSLH